MSRAATAPYIVDGRFLAGQVTGLHRVARSLLSAARDAGLDAQVWAPRPTAPRDAADPLVDRTFPLPGGRLGGRVWEQLVLPTAARGSTVVSLTNTAPLLAPGVVMVHDLAASVGPQWFAHSMRSYAATVLAGARRARLVLTVSHAVADELRRAGVAAERLVVVAPAVDPRFSPPSPATVESFRRRHGLHRRYAVLVGWSDPRKDVATATAAHRLVLDTEPHDLVLVGGTHPSFANVTLPHGLPSLHRLGRVSDGDLVALLGGAAVLLYPSRYEGFGLPPLEALACGTPAVASDIPAVRESTAGLVRLEPVGDVAAWAAALADGLSGRLRCPSPPTRRWPEAGRELVEAIRQASVR